MLKQVSRANTPSMPGRLMYAIDLLHHVGLRRTITRLRATSVCPAPQSRLEIWISAAPDGKVNVLLLLDETRFTDRRVADWQIMGWAPHPLRLQLCVVSRMCQCRKGWGFP